jgi:HAD superfamily hydrolase (TIGR01509 family)
VTSSAQVFAAAQLVMIDFDGPVCSVFASFAPAAAAEAMRASLQGRGARVAAAWNSVPDPHALIALIGESGDQEALSVAENCLTRTETHAVGSAAMTDGLREFLESLHNRNWAIVSNNSTDSITHYFSIIQAQQPPAIFGRVPNRPDLMKPSPFLLNQALRSLGGKPEEAVFLGDSASDVTAGLAARVPTIGYANKPGKRQTLEAAGATNVIDTLAALTTGDNSLY